MIAFPMFLPLSIAFRICRCWGRRFRACRTGWRKTSAVPASKRVETQLHEDSSAPHHRHLFEAEREQVRALMGTEAFQQSARETNECRDAVRSPEYPLGPATAQAPRAKRSLRPAWCTDRVGLVPR